MHLSTCPSIQCSWFCLKAAGEHWLYDNADFPVMHASISPSNLSAKLCGLFRKSCGVCLAIKRCCLQSKKIGCLKYQPFAYHRQRTAPNMHCQANALPGHLEWLEVFHQLRRCEVWTKQPQEGRTGLTSLLLQK